MAIADIVQAETRRDEPRRGEAVAALGGGGGGRGLVGMRRLDVRGPNPMSFGRAWVAEVGLQCAPLGAFFGAGAPASGGGGIRSRQLCGRGAWAFRGGRGEGVGLGHLHRIWSCLRRFF